MVERAYKKLGKSHEKNSNPKIPLSADYSFVWSDELAPKVAKLILASIRNKSQSAVLSGVDYTSTVNCQLLLTSHLVDWSANRSLNAIESIIKCFATCQTDAGRVGYHGQVTSLLFDSKLVLTGLRITPFLLNARNLLFKTNNYSPDVFQFCVSLNNSLCEINFKWLKSTVSNEPQQKSEFLKSLKILGFNEQDVGFVFKVIESILFLGNLQFVQTNDQPDVKNRSILRKVADLLDLKDAKTLELLLISKKVNGKVSYHPPIECTRKAEWLAGRLYLHLFTWVIDHINMLFKSKECHYSLTIVRLASLNSDLSLNSFLSYAMKDRIHAVMRNQEIRIIDEAFLDNAGSTGLILNPFKKYSDIIWSYTDDQSLLNMQKSRNCPLNCQHLVNARFRSGSDCYFYYKHHGITKEYDCTDFDFDNRAPDYYLEMPSRIFRGIFGTSSPEFDNGYSKLLILNPLEPLGDENLTFDYEIGSYVELIDMITLKICNIIEHKSNFNIVTLSPNSGVFDQKSQLELFDVSEFSSIKTFADPVRYSFTFDESVNKFKKKASDWSQLHQQPTSQEICEYFVKISSLQGYKVCLGNRRIFMNYDSVRFLSNQVDERYLGNINSTAEPVSVIEITAAPAVNANSSKAPKKKYIMSSTRVKWLCCTWFLTWYIPGFVLGCCGIKTGNQRMAWREKLALCIIIFLMCGALMFFIIGFGPLICPREDAYSIFEVNLKKEMKDPWVYAYGKVYQVGELVGNHKSSYGIEEFTFFPSLGQDVSNLFFKAEKFSSYCPNLAEPSGWDNLINRPPPDKTRFPHKSAGKPYLENMNKYAKGRLLWTTKDVEKSSSSKKRLIIIGQNVYDVTSYFTANVKFLGPAVEQIFGTLYGKDATNAWMSLSRNDPKAPEYLKCMNAMFYIGAVDNRNSFKCQFSNYLLLTVSAMLLSVVCVKFLSSLQFGSEKLPEDYKKNVIIQVPCYTEGFESLSKTLESLAMTRYDNGSKLIFVICDGMIIGDGNDKPTPSIVLDILGNESTSNPNIFKYQSLGKGPLRQNCGKVYSGIFNHRGNHVPYIVVVKLGNGSEQVKPGNRGKRDSQLLLLRFLSRIHFQSDMSPLELEIFHHMKNILQKHPKLFEYLLMVDSDTTITENALNKLIATMVHDSKIAGLCGETLVDNEKQSWVTMIQVYEYFISHHLSKAFESLFGSVTCLPGCFCLYRIRTPKTRVPIIISPALLKDYSENNVRTLHMKNLLHLGEDRFLTTLVMKHFPGFKLKFDAEAKCLTNVPDRWSVLVSQRRRWINSTIHNLFELLSLQQLCGFCCLSMRFVVFLDLFSTMVQPAGVLYIVYLFYNIYASQEVFPVVSIIIVASIYGLQYILATPVFSFCIPVYSFWHFDDFSWGDTRLVNLEGAQEDEDDDNDKIVLGKWNDDYKASSEDPEPSQTSTVSITPSQASGRYERKKGLYSAVDINRQIENMDSARMGNLKIHITDLLESIGFESMTDGKFRELLEQKVGLDLSGMKDEIIACVEEILQKRTE